MKLGLVLEIAIVLTGVSPPAHAETTTRIRVPVSALPTQRAPTKISRFEDVVLPDGVRHGSPVPKSWTVTKAGAFETNEEYSRCTDGRRASVGTVSGNGETSTQKIWERNGEVYFDEARVKVEDDKVYVIEAYRSPVVYVGAAMWAYRDDIAIRLVSARDAGMFSKAVFYGCSLDTMLMNSPSVAKFGSDPEEATEVMNKVLAMKDGQTHKRRVWQGVAFSALASVSKATADAEPMLNIVIKQP
jgi:hypothetical protein